MNRGLDEVFPPTPEVWAELARHEMAGDHQFGKAGLVRPIASAAQMVAAISPLAFIRRANAAWSH